MRSRIARNDDALEAFLPAVDCEVMKLVMDFCRKGAIPLMFHEKIRSELLCDVFDSVVFASFEAGKCVASTPVEDRRRFLLGGGLMAAFCMLRIDFVVRFGEGFIGSISVLESESASSASIEPMTELNSLPTGLEGRKRRNFDYYFAFDCDLLDGTVCVR